MRYYKISVPINASHNFCPESGEKNAHFHTFNICLLLKKLSEDFIEFDRAEEVVRIYFDKYRGKYLNSIPPFDQMLPTIENMGNVFFYEFSERLITTNFKLLQLEIGESLCAVYTISDSIETNMLQYGKIQQLYHVFTSNIFTE